MQGLMRDALLRHVANMEELVIEHVEFLQDKPSHDMRSMSDALSLSGGLLKHSAPACTRKGT